MVDDQAVVRAGVARLLGPPDGFEVVAQGADGAELLKRIDELASSDSALDLVVMDVRMAGLDGIENRIHPGEAATKDLYHLPPEEDAKIPTVCSSLDQALESLDRDREFLTRGGVFTNDMIDAYIALKMEEVQRIRMTTHPAEFDMYYSC